MWRTVRNTLLKILGDIKYFLVPPVLVYNPVTFRVKGADTRAALSRLQPGDIVLRGYDCYLDGLLIPGTYSHTGLYVGNDKLVHAIAEGVQYVDVLDFLRCDRFCVMRPSHGVDTAIARAAEFVRKGTAYDFDFRSGNAALYCHELGAEAYRELGVRKMIPTLCWGLIRGKPAFLADSFMNSPSFRKIMEFNPRNVKPRCVPSW